MIDDGGHHVRDQLATFAAIFERGLSPGGIYAIEDIETSYWEDGTPLYGRPTKGPAGCDGKGSGRSTVDTFLSIVHAAAHVSTSMRWGKPDILCFSCPPPCAFLLPCRRGGCALF